MAGDYISNRYPGIIAIKLSRNFGHQIALTAGLSAVNGRNVFVIDADLQDPPELLEDMLKKMKDSGADVVFG
jgi:glycosyltransferase involved in cell wall biosynthesis